MSRIHLKIDWEFKERLMNLKKAAEKRILHAPKLPKYFDLTDFIDPHTFLSFHSSLK